MKKGQQVPPPSLQPEKVQMSKLQELIPKLMGLDQVSAESA